jgi:hypothetical protein
MILVRNNEVVATEYFLEGQSYKCPGMEIPVSDAVELDIVAQVGNIIRDGVVSPSAKQLRDHRDELLANSDWTQVADAPVDKAAWATYRQALRDIPLQTDFPWNTTWPTQPE